MKSKFIKLDTTGKIAHINIDHIIAILEDEQRILLSNGEIVTLTAMSLRKVIVRVKSK